ncbi:MAG: DUF4214 domain-containing protein [Acidobacteriota bacterium]|nr:DUF4214 domain-containing protein [Acidobacteriota bacterium]
MTCATHPTSDSRRTSFYLTSFRRFARADVLRRAPGQAVRIALVIALLAGQAPAAPVVLSGIAEGWRADFSFWLLSSGWAAAGVQGKGGGSSGPRTRPSPVPRPSPKPQEKQAERDARVSRVRIYPGDVTLELDEPVVLAAIAYDANNAPVGGVRFTWSGQDTGRGNRGMRVSSTGEFQSPVAGKYKVTARGAGRQAHVFVTVRENEGDGDGERRRVRPPVVPRRVSTRDLPPAQQAAGTKGRRNRRQSTRDARGVSSVARGTNFAKASFVKSSLAGVTAAAAHASPPSPSAALLLPDENEWNDNNYMTADDPGNERGDMPGTPVDDGAGSSNFQMVAPVLGLPGRGIDLSLGLAYNSRVWHKAGNDITFDIDRDWPAPGWSLGFGKMIRMGANSGSMLIDADGTRHGFQGMYTWAGHFEGHTTDGTFIDYKHDNSWDGTGYNGPLSYGSATYPNGTYVRYAAQGQGAIYPTFIYDASGNTVKVTYRNNSGPQIHTVTDTLGRVVTFHYDENDLLTAITAPSLDGGPTPRPLVRLHYRQHTLDYAFSGQTPRVRNTTVWVIDAIYYPATDTGYWFGDADSYSSYGMIRKVVEQRGMSFAGPDPVPPDQGVTPQGTVNPGLMSRQMVYDYPLTPDGSLTDAPTYTTMRETWEGMDAGPAVTEYIVQQNATPRRVEVKQPDGTRSVQLSYNNPGQFNDGLVYQDETLDADDRRLSKSTVSWEQGAYESPRPVRTEVTDELGQLTATAFSYGPVYNQVTEVRNFGYGGTALLRKTLTEYENGSNYTNRHIFNLVKTVEVYAADVTTRESRTEYEYDGQTLQDAPGVGRHDITYNPYAPTEEFCYWGQDQNDPDCGSGYEDSYCQQVYNCYTFNPYNPATAYRGNVTQVKTYADAVNLGGAIIETRRYDITGNLVTASASCCEQTSFTYTLDTQYAYPESQTRGAADSSNWNARVTTRALYHFNVGLAYETRDPNGRGTYTGYHAETLRPYFTFDLWTGGQTSFLYDDAAQTVSEITFTTQGAVAEHNVRYLNGRGQVRREEALGANNVWDVVETKYDVFGRVWQQSRPYRDGQEGPRWGETAYDALGRVQSVRAPDGSLAQNFYNESTRPGGASGEPGQTMRMVDAWARERWGRTDAQNRLVEVVEPQRRGSGAVVGGGGSGGRMASGGTNSPSKGRRPPKDIVPLRHGTEALGQVTTYQYNTLGDLVETVQGPQTRRFRYDSLGRLTHQKLAETRATLNDDGVYVGAGGAWGDVMSYDERSNLTWRTDARGVRTQFAYNNDPLNRLHAVSYDMSGFGDTGHPVAPAAPVTYEYRERPSETTYVDVTQVKKVTAAGVSIEEYGFDTIGRTVDKTLTLVSRAAYPQRTDYVYDSLDRVTDVRYPAQYRTGQTNAPRKLVHHDYDAASRINKVQVDGTDYASALDYNAASQTTSLSVGAGSNQIGERYDYDPQTGLLTGQRVERGGGARLLDLSYDYVRAGTAGGRTGQLTRITNHRDRNKDRDYQYDALGRLRRAIAGQQSHWVQAYDYDRFGNCTRVVQTVGTEAYVTNFYTVALGREPSSSEMSGWANSLRQAFVQGAQGQQWDAVLQEAQALGSEVFNSSEYAAHNRTDEQFVTDLYQAFLQREPESEGVVDRLEYPGTNGRAQTVTQFSAGDDVRQCSGRLQTKGTSKFRALAS